MIKHPAFSQSMLRKFSLHRRLGSALAVSALIALCISPALAVDAPTTQWAGVGSTTSTTDWDTVTNWSTGAKPTASTVAEFSATFSNQPVLGSNAATAGLWATTGLGQDVLITGSGNRTLTLTGSFDINGNANTAILLDDSANHNLTLGVNTVTSVINDAKFLVNNSGTLTIGAMTITAAKTLTLGGTNAAGNILISGAISNTTGAVVVNTAGTVTLSGTNSFTGGLTLTGGTLKATTATGNLGNGTLSLGGGSLIFADSAARNYARNTTVTGDTTIISDKDASGSGVTYTLGTLSIGNSTLNVTGGANVNSGTAALTVGATTLTGSATFSVTNPAGGGLSLMTFNNAITGGTNSFTKTGNGTTVFAGSTNANTYTGLTTVSGGELQLNKTAATNAIAGNLTIGNATVRNLAKDQLADTTVVTITTGGTYSLNNLGETFGGLNISSSGASAMFDLGNQGASNPVKITGTAVTLTFGTNTFLGGTGTLTPNTTTAPMTFNFNGGQMNGGTITTGGAAALTSTILNVTSSMGSGTFIAGASGNTAGTSLAVNLNQTGTMNLGTTILAYSNVSGGNPTLLNVTVANTATGLSGGIITPALTANVANPEMSLPVDLKNGFANTLTFAAGGSGFNLSGGIIDVRSSVATAGFGAITTNGNALTISGGKLLGNSLVSTTGAITLSSGYLGLRNTGTTTNFTISTSDGSNGRTIKMLSGNTGTFTAASTVSSTNRIIIGSLSNSGTWDRGILNAGQNYTIAADGTGASPFGSSFASYTIGNNSGLNGVVMGGSAIPALLTLGTNASFLVASSTAAARTYNVGVTGGTNDIVVPASGGFGFGINNTNASNAQIINLNRDKGADTITLVSSGASLSGGVNINTDQTGGGNIYLMARNLTLPSGVTFSGTGGIYTDVFAGDGITQLPLSNFAGNIAGAASVVPMSFFINGTLNGTNTISLNQDASQQGTFAVGSTAVIGGVQSWFTSHSVSSGTIFANSMTSGSNWTGSVSLNGRGSYGQIEASTSTVSPSVSSNYKFSALTLQSAGNAATGFFKLTNNVQNDGGSAKEAFYASSISVSGGIIDGSNGHYLFSLNGQDLYVDRFNNVTGLTGKGLSFQNDALNTTSVIRALDVAGDSISGGFQALNGATLEINGGSFDSLIFNRNTGSSGTVLAADTAAAPNGGAAGATDFKKTLVHTGTGNDIGTFTSFLGSGANAGGNTSTTGSNSNGTLRIVGGGFSSSGYILNPVGANGLIDTTNGGSDTTLNTVLIRGNTALDSGSTGNSTAYPALIVAGTTTINGNLIIGNATGAANQATLRVGGDSAVGYSAVTGPSAHSGTGTLIVNGDLTTESTVNVSIQSNGNVKAGGNVSISGTGANVSFAINPITGKDGVGIHASSHFTLNGNKGVATPQTINVVPSVGNFHVGDGSAGILSGSAAQAQLTGNLTVSSSADINGPASSLDLNGRTMTVSSGLTVGGNIKANGVLNAATTLITGGIVSGTGSITGALVAQSGAHVAPGNSAGVLTINNTANLANNTVLDFDLDTADVAAGTGGNDLLSILGTGGSNGDLTIGTGFTLNITAGMNFAAGTYSLITYTGALTDNSSSFSGWTVNGLLVDQTASFSLGANAINLVVVPEPGSAVLLLSGFGVLVGLQRSRRRR